MALASRLAQGRTYYGWYVVAVAFVVYLFFVSLSHWATAVFIRPMTQDLSWSRTDFQWVLSFGTILTGLAAILTGPIIDRYGGRRLVIWGAFLAGGGTMLTALVSHRWEFFLLRGILVPVGMAGMSHMVAGIIVANWFVKRRGQAMGIATMGMSIAQIALPPLSGIVVHYWGWRAGWVALGGVLWALVLPLGLLFLRRRPEDMGLMPDGVKNPPAAASASPLTRPREVAWTRGQAMRTRALWLFILSFNFASIPMSAMSLYFVFYMTGPPLNLPLMTATAAISVGGWAALLSKPPWGFLADRIPERYCIALNYLIKAAAILALIWARPLPAVYGILILWGIGIGGSTPLTELAYANAFGRLHLGSIRALTMPFSVGAGAAGPMMAAWLFDVAGSYDSIFIIFATLFALAALVILMAVPPKPREGRL